LFGERLKGMRVTIGVNGDAEREMKQEQIFPSFLEMTKEILRDAGF
jgi:hypothetical protein